MAKTKREYILATCLLSGAAAIISFVALGTQEWVTSSGKFPGGTSSQGSIRFGLFGGVFRQNTGGPGTYDLTTVCLLDKNICALLCGDNMSKNLERLDNGRKEEIPDQDINNCVNINTYYSNLQTDQVYYRRTFEATAATEKYFFNAGIWICTILFLILSGVMGLFSAALAVYNTAANPYQAWLSVFGMYIYNGIAFFCVLVSIALWGGLYSQDIINNDIPTYKVFLEGFTTQGYASLGYSYWINLVSLFLYLISLCLLYIRNYLISREPNVTVQIEDNADPVIYLY